MIQTQLRRLAPGIALIFDLDGVIADTNPVHREAWVAYNLRFGIPTDEAMLEFMYGKHNDDIVRRYFGGDLAATDIAAHGSAKEALYREMIRAPPAQRDGRGSRGIHRPLGGCAPGGGQ